MGKAFPTLNAATLLWKDGVPYSKEYQDIYFSIENGLAESEHNFIESNNLLERWQSIKNDNLCFVIAETGFGTGLNFILTWYLWRKYAPQSARLHFISCESNPLSKDDLLQCAKLWPKLSDLYNTLLQQYPSLIPGTHRLQFEQNNVSLTLLFGDAVETLRSLINSGDLALESLNIPFYVDAWFLDGFAPSKNPDIWSESLFKLISMLSRPSVTTLSTYTVAGKVRDGLQKVGFDIRKKPGFGSKREMLVATYKNIPETSFMVEKHTPWHIGFKPSVSDKVACVIGAGFAGSFIAYELARRGWQVRVFERHAKMAQGASGVSQAVIYPTLSGFLSPMTEWILYAYLYAIRKYRFDDLFSELVQWCGSLVFNKTSSTKNSQQKLSMWLRSYPEIAISTTAKQASDIAGITILENALYLPSSGWVDLSKLCDRLLSHPSIEICYHSNIDKISFQSGQWQVGDVSAPVVILSNGCEAREFYQTNWLPLKPITGQLTTIDSTQDSEKLRTILCGYGHILPAINQQHLCGATYRLNSACTHKNPNDNIDNLEKIANLPVNVMWSKVVKSAWAGVRATTPDYMPIVGMVPNPAHFMSHYALMQKDAKRWIASYPEVHPGLYVFTGFGSKAAATVPFCAEHLASTIDNEPSCAPLSMRQNLSPARFLRNSLIRGKN